MMTRTCTVQVNLDYASEQDMLRKLRVSLLLQPLATALFANSPFTEGRPNGFLSYRAHVWTDTDNAALRHPAGDVRARLRLRALRRMAGRSTCRCTSSIAMAHTSTWPAPRSAISWTGRLHNVAGAVATVGDFADHITTVFTDVRIKRFLEMRGADAGRADMMVAQSAFWVGLLYDEAALTAAEALLRGATWEDAVALRAAVPREGLAASWRGGSLRDLARDAVAISRDGLRARGHRNDAGLDEVGLSRSIGGDRRRRTDPGRTLAGALSSGVAG